MTLFGINDIGGIGPVRPPDQQKLDKTQGQNPDTSQIGPVDSTNFAPESREFARIQEAARLVLESLPDVRTDKVELARKRLDEGYYDRPEIKAKVAESLLQDPELKVSSELTPDRLEEIERRLQSGYYNDPAVVDRIARGLLDDIGDH